MPKFTDPIGFSKLDTFRTCKAKFKYQFIDKLPQPGSTAMDRGSRIHDDAEAYLRGWSSTLPVELENWQEQFDMLKAKKCKAEAAWGFDKLWQILPNWLHPDTWLRAKSDAHYLEGDTLTVIDFKTGKFRVPSAEQIELYAICGACVYPEAKQVKAEFWFVDTGQVYERLYTRAHLEELKKKYEGYFSPIYAEEVWPPSPSRECKWCAYSCSNDGPCQF